MYKNKKAIAPVVATSILMVVAVISVVGFSGWYETFSSNLIADLETDSNSNNFNVGVESLVDDKLYINAGDGMDVSKVEIDGIDCNINGSYSGLSKIDVSTCLSQVTSTDPEIVVISGDKIFVESTYIDQETLDNAIPSSTEIVSLNSDILTFQTNYSDLTITDITIDGISVFTYPQKINYNLDISLLNKYDTYSCNSGVTPVGGLDEGIYTISDLGFDFPFFSFNYISGTDFYVDTNGKISTSDSTSDYMDIENSFINFDNIAPISSNLDLTNMYVCPNQGTTPNNYAVVKFTGGMYWYNGNIDNEVVLHENGDIEFHYGGLVDLNSYPSPYVGISDGSSQTEHEIISNFDTLANTSRFYSPIDPNPYKNLSSGVYNIDLSSLGVLDLTNGPLEFITFTDKGNFNKTLNVGPLFDSCSLNGINLNHTQSYKFFNSPTSTYPNFCQSESRTCKNGELSGTELYTYSNCTLNGFPSNLIFSSTWNTSKTGVSSSNQIKLPLVESGSYNFLVEWGDGKSDMIYSWNQEEVTHTYITPGLYDINISGVLEGFGFYVEFSCFSNDVNDGDKLLDISQWGNMKFGNTGKYFCGAENFDISALDNPDLSETTNFNSMFYDAKKFNGDISGWDVSLVTDMYSMFAGASDFNQPLNSWNTSSVTNMEGMFANSFDFNQPINSWDVSKVVIMERMFYGANTFNRPLNNWSTSSVTNMNRMFRGANTFNENISSWDTSSVTDMSSMFFSMQYFNQPLNNWNTSSVTNMGNMFQNTDDFNQPLNSWDVSSVTDMGQMFTYTDDFNQPLNNWNTSSVTDMGSMFNYALVFNQPLNNNWDTSSVTNMNRMFFGTKNFNQNIDSWDTSSVTNIGYMFQNTESFNQPLNSWNVSSVIIMNNMFTSSWYFNQPLNSWDTSSVTNMNGMFDTAYDFNRDISMWNVSSVTTYTNFDATSNAGWSAGEKPTFP